MKTFESSESLEAQIEGEEAGLENDVRELVALAEQNISEKPEAPRSRAWKEYIQHKKEAVTDLVRMAGSEVAAVSGVGAFAYSVVPEHFWSVVAAGGIATGIKTVSDYFKADKKLFREELAIKTKFDGTGHAH